jgi:predicted SAM-dependent methyltransferase
MKLIISAGDRRIQGFTHHDVRNLPGIDIVCDLWDLPENVTQESCSEIQFTHALEHFPTADTQQVLTLIWGLMAPGAKLYIEVPNFAWHAQLVQEGRERDAVYYAFGGQLDEYDFHKTGFTPAILEEELLKAGFINIKLQPASSISVTCQK